MRRLLPYIKSLIEYKPDCIPWWLIFAPLINLILLIVVPLWPGVSGNLPGGVPADAAWYGLMGGLAASLSGMFLHNKKWDDSYNLWHFFAGVMGAIFGVFAYLTLAIIARSATSSTGAVDGSSPTILAGAFLAGFLQHHFATMSRKMFDRLFRSVDDNKKPDEANKPQTPESK